jgi:formyltetrahydrofolate synthetase
MPKKMKITDEECARIAEKCKEKSTREVAAEMGWDRKRINNILQRYKRNQSKIAKKFKELPPGKPIKVTSIQQTTTPETSGKAMVIITTDINMIKKLIGEL